MAKILLKDILSKLSNIFKNDIYIYKKRYIVGGHISESRNVTRFLCVLNVEYIELFNCIPEEDELVYLLDIKKSKDTFQSDITNNIDDNTKEEIISFIKTTEHKIDSVKSWDNFDWNDKDKITLFEDNDSLLLFENSKKYPSVLISKTIFPLITIKNCDNLYFHVNLPKEKKDLVELMTSFDFDLFQIYNIITYLDLSVVDEDE